MPQIPGQTPVECADCGAHFQIDPSGNVADAACSECGGKRFFRSQPSATESDGALRDMVDPLTQKDTGGFPLDEGTIMHGDGGVRPGRGGFDYMHSNMSYTSKIKNESMKPSRTLNMDPYPPLWDESYLPAKTAGPLAELAAPLAEKALPFAIGTMMKGIFGGGQQSGSMAPQIPEPAPSMNMLGSTDIPFLLLGDYDTPHSVKSVGEQHDDPEHQDQKEFNVGDKNPSNQKNPNLEDSGVSGEDGVKDATPGYGFGENSPALERAQMILPLLLHYLQSDESGQSDPLIRGLHDALERENPGYMDNEHPEGHKYVEMIIQQHNQPHHVQAGVNAFPGGLGALPGQGNDPMATQGTTGICPQCGGALAADGSCPQCGMKQHPLGGTPGSVPTGADSNSYAPNHTFVGTSGAGPQTPEQKAAVVQLLEHQKRYGDIPMVELEPWRFAQELAQIQGQHNVAPLVDPSQSQPTPAPMQPMQGAPGAMPVTDPSQMEGGGGMPMQPMAALSASGIMACPRCQGTGHYEGTYCPDCGGVGQFAPSSPGSDGAYAQNRLSPDDYTHYEINDPERTRYGPVHQGKKSDANNAVRRCPHCGSATTSIVEVGDNNTDGTSDYTGHCSACNKNFPLKHGHVILTDLMNPALQNAADRYDTHPDEGQDSSLTWKDHQGRPLVQGGTYELHTPGMDAPDQVKVVAKKPDQLDLKLVGQAAGIYGLDDSQPDFHVTAQQMANNGYTFVPSGDPQAGEQPGGMPGMEQIPQSPPTTDEMGSSYPNPGTMSHLVVASDDEVEIDEDICHRCGNTWIEHTASSATQTMHECTRCGTAWETEDSDFGREAHADLGWINESSDYDTFDMDRAQAMRGVGGPSRSLAVAAAKDTRLQTLHERLEENKMARVAGRHFTPGEQRALINERGTARNIDDLDLSNTHYLTRYDPTGKANGENAPLEHLVLGL